MIALKVKTISVLMTALIFSLCVPSYATTFEETPQLSLSTIIMFALDENPDVLMAQERRQQLEYFRKEAASEILPQIELNAEAGREYISPTSGNNTNNLGKASLRLNQKLFDGFATRAEIARRDKLTDGAEIDIDGQKQTLIIEVIQNYLDVLRFQGVTEATESFVVEIDKIVANISKMYEAGAIGKAMLDYAQSRQAAAYVDINEAKSSLNDGISNLEFLTGPLPDFRTTYPDMLHPNRLDRQFYIELGGEENTVIRKNQKDIDAMKQQLRVEKGAYFPDVDLAVEAEQSHNDGGETGRNRNVKATVNLTYDIFDGYNRQNRVNRVSSQIRELQYRDTKIFDQLKRDINLAYNQIKSLQNAIKSTNSEIQSNAALQKLNRENFRLGAINAIELIEGEERLKAAYVKKYRQEYDLYLNTYSLLVSTSVLEDQYFCSSCEFVQDETQDQ